MAGVVSKERLESLLGKGYVKYTDLERALTDLVRQRKVTIEALLKIVAELDGHHKNVNVSKLVGSGIGIIGALVGIIGLILIPFSAGISTIVAGVGAGIGGAGGMITSGACVTECGISWRLMKHAQKAIEADKQKCEDVKALWSEYEECCDQIMSMVESSDTPKSGAWQFLKEKWEIVKKDYALEEDEEYICLQTACIGIMERLKHLREDLYAAVKDSWEYKCLKKACAALEKQWDYMQDKMLAIKERFGKAAYVFWKVCSFLKSMSTTVGRAVILGLDIGVAVARGLEECGRPGMIACLAIKCIGITAMRVFDALFTVAGLVLDLWTFITVARDMRNGSPSPSANELRDVVDKLKKEQDTWSSLFLEHPSE